MRSMTFIIALAITVSCYAEEVLTDSTSSPQPGKHLFILSGQSNMHHMNHKLTFVPAVEEAFGKGNVKVVRSAKRGASIRGWYTGEKSRGPLYTKLMGTLNRRPKGKKVTEETKIPTIKVYDTVTFVWMQGESDTKPGRVDAYADNFRGLLGFLKEDLQITSLNVVIGRLSDYSTKNEWMQMREIQVKLAEDDPHGGWINTDDLNDKEREGKMVNDLHYTKEGYNTLGKRFAEKAIELIEKQKK